MSIPFSVRRILTLALPAITLSGMLCLAQCGTVRAADDTVQKPAIIRVGAVFPSDPDKSATHASIGLTYEFCRARPSMPVAFGLYGDYLIPSAKTVRISAGDFAPLVSTKSSGFDAGISGRYLIRSKAMTSPYVGIGFGAYGVVITPSDGLSGETYVSVGGKVMAGVEFKSGFLSEIVYQIFPNSNGYTNHTTVGGVGFNVGYHF